MSSTQRKTLQVLLFERIGLVSQVHSVANQRVPLRLEVKQVKPRRVKAWLRGSSTFVWEAVVFVGGKQK